MRFGIEGNFGVSGFRKPIALMGVSENGGP